MGMDRSASDSAYRKASTSLRLCVGMGQDVMPKGKAFAASKDIDISYTPGTASGWFAYGSFQRAVTGTAFAPEVHQQKNNRGRQRGAQGHDCHYFSMCEEYPEDLTSIHSPQISKDAVPSDSSHGHRRQK